MKIGRNILIGFLVVFAISVGIFFMYGLNATKGSATGNSISASQSAPAGSVKTIYATIDHSIGYEFTGDGASGTTITVNKEDTVKIITQDNQPRHNHGITIDEYGINQVTSQNPVIQFSADKAGSFNIYCKSCDEGPLGSHPWMTGTLVVNP